MMQPLLAVQSCVGILQTPYQGLRFVYKAQRGPFEGHSMPPIVSYLRVSTTRQGRSGLGLEAQRAAIARFVEAEGYEVIEEFVEVESGKGADALDLRPELASALARAKRTKCPVVVARL